MRNIVVALYGAAVLATWPAVAQQRPAAPTDPAAPGSVITYESAFSGYVPYQDQPTADWRTVNDEVAAVGGHVGIVGGAGHAGHGNKPTVKPGASDTSAARAPAAAASKPAPAKPAHH